MTGGAAPDAFAPAELGPLTLRNRIIKAATFEGASPNGKVTDRLVDFHRKIAAGGAAVSVEAYLAVSPEGRTDRHCVLLGKESVEGLTRVTRAITDEGAIAGAQIGHAGPVANAKSNRATTLGPSKKISPMGSVIAGATTADIERILGDYRRGAEIAVESGFRFLEVHMGHNYLVSSFLSPKLNKRSDDYGGSLEHRARLAREVAAAVRESVGRDVAVTAKLNMTDGVPGGFEVDESLQVAAMLEADGNLDAIELTGGSSLANPMYLFRGDAPRKDFAAAMPQPLRLGLQLVGWRFLKAYPYEEAFFLDQARRFRERLSMPLILLGGVSKRETIERAMGEGFEFVAMGRALLMEPDLVTRMAAGAATESTCIHCNRCMPTIYSGTRCVLLEEEQPA